MTQSIFLAPVGNGVGLTSISLGLVRAFEAQGYPVAFFKPIEQASGDPSRELVQQGSAVYTEASVSFAEAEQLLASGQADLLLETVLERCESLRSGDRILIIEGLNNSDTLSFAESLNRQIAQTLGAKIVMVASAESQDCQALNQRLEIAASPYGGAVCGAIVNKVGGIGSDDRIAQMSVVPDQDTLARCKAEITALPVFRHSGFSLVATVPWNPDLAAPRVQDLAQFLDAKIVSAGDMIHRRVRSVSLCSRTAANLVSHLQANTLLISAGDRADIIMAACLAVQNGIKLGGLLLTGGFAIHPNIMTLCQPAFQAGLPVLGLSLDTWSTARLIQRYPHELPTDDLQRIERVKEHVAQQVDRDWLHRQARQIQETLLSPVAFRHMLTRKAQAAKQRIVLPEGNEPRTIKAAAICARRGIAHCILLGDASEIESVAAGQGIDLNVTGLEIWNPDPLKDELVPALVELRKHKALTALDARDQLNDNVVVGTMLLQQGRVDGLVSGAVHTTANTIRPALSLIKTAPGNSLVSSVFFMLLPDRVLVYGDCAINPDPSAEQLADIALQSALSASQFGLEPRVAMISYSTGSSGSGADVEKVRAATALARARAPELLIDGPLQYDAAIMPDVARSKAPDSPVAGRANVFVFPDLNTGNTTYKAVQRSANALSIGPMLQGLNKPVNDLSRGALVDDIVYTIALTAIQAQPAAAEN